MRAANGHQGLSLMALGKPGRLRVDQPTITSKELRLAPGVAFSSRTILRIGVAALGVLRATVFTIIAVTTLSTIAMVLYPLIGHLLALHPRAKRRVSRRHHS